VQGAIPSNYKRSLLYSSNRKGTQTYVTIVVYMYFVVYISQYFHTPNIIPPV
jgi:hypothetical protein